MYFAVLKAYFIYFNHLKLIWTEYKGFFLITWSALFVRLYISHIYLLHKFLSKFLGTGDNFFQMKGHAPFLRENAKTHDLLTRSNGSISIKIVTIHHCVKRIPVCSNERRRLSPRGDNKEIAKSHWQHLNIFSRTFLRNFDQTLHTKYS